MSLVPCFTQLGTTMLFAGKEVKTRRLTDDDKKDLKETLIGVCKDPLVAMAKRVKDFPPELQPSVLQHLISLNPTLMPPVVELTYASMMPEYVTILALHILVGISPDEITKEITEDNAVFYQEQLIRIGYGPRQLSQEQIAKQRQALMNQKPIPPEVAKREGLNG